MQYNLDSDSDEEETRGTDTSQTMYLADLEEMKSFTNDLLSKDKHSKKERNRMFLLKMLNLEEPVITAKMVDYLLQEDVCDTLLEFITKIDKGPRPSRDDPNSELMRIAYK